MMLRGDGDGIWLPKKDHSSPTHPDWVGFSPDQAPEGCRPQAPSSSTPTIDADRRHARQTHRRQAPYSSAATTIRHSTCHQDEVDEHPGYIIHGPPPAVRYCGKLEKYRHWGNEVKLYNHHVDTLFGMFWHKNPEIPYYVCTINKTSAKPGQRTVYYTKENLEDYIDPNDDTLKVKLARSARRLSHLCRNRATITTNWSEFRNLAKIYEGDICAFRFEVTRKCRLVLIVHRL